MIEPLIADLLKELGEDPHREGLSKTPERVAKAYRYLTSGYGRTVTEVLGDAIFTEHYDEMVVMKDIEVYSLCEHHLLPFFGKAHIAYLPDGRIVGLSKLPRMAGMFARRLQVQERLTTDIAGAIETVLRPKGVAVVAEAIHLCMMMRGVEQQNAFAITSSLRGEFAHDPKTRAEFMELIRHPKPSFA